MIQKRQKQQPSYLELQISTPDGLRATQQPRSNIQITKNTSLELGSCAWGKDKTYTAGFISARMVRRTIEVSKEVNFDNITPEELDKLMNYIVELFGNQFTRDELYDGLASKNLIPTITKCINEVIGEVSSVTSGEEKNR